MSKIFLKTHLAIILAVCGIIISLLLMKAFYRFDIFFASEGFFVPYGYFIAKKEWISATVKLGLRSLLFTGLLFCLTLTFYKRRKLALGFGISSLVIAICFYASFYVLYPDYNYKYHPYMFGYMTWDGQYIANTDRYFQTVEKYGFEPKAYRPLQTLDDAIKGLEFAKKRNNKTMYEHIFNELKGKGFEGIIEKYTDITFQVYLLGNIIYVSYDKGSYMSEKEDANEFFKKIGLIKRLGELTGDLSVRNTIVNILNKYQDYTKGIVTEQDFFNSLDAIRDGFYNLKLQGVNYEIL